ncbi:MAG: glucose-1-phosphate adenylyltransferase subunit GlgD [Eubacteriaceae bacterium]|jgi:glucose-1-phosphate adenylyltransferase
MKNTLGILLPEFEENTDLRDLLQHRSIGTLPFGGRYRLIDFNLSNMVNSGIGKIGVISSSKYSSIIDHLGTGKEWMLSRKTNDLSILRGSSSTRIGEELKVNMRDFIDNKAYFERFNTDTVVIAGSNMVTCYDFNEPYQIFKKNDADITLVYRKDEPSFHALDNDLYLKLDGHRVVGMDRFHDRETDDKFVDMLIIKKSVLLDMISSAQNSGEWDMMDIIANNLGSLKVYGALHTGYINRITDVEKYYNASMDLLDYNILKELFMTDRPIYTKIKDNHPTMYGDDAEIADCIVGSGSKIDAKLDHCVVFREATIEEGSQVSNSIIMQKCTIGKNVKLDHVIFDKECVIRDNASLIGTESDPIILSKRTTI